MTLLLEREFGTRLVKLLGGGATELKLFWCGGESRLTANPPTSKVRKLIPVPGRISVAYAGEGL